MVKSDTLWYEPLVETVDDGDDEKKGGKSNCDKFNNIFLLQGGT